ncbi:ribonuclease P protein component [Rothia sp. ZJ1223]|uniref:ribonuclease P protein component n=1 Tax=Rothia sp. ZJ1223 TaxID=2811098 RepID=UPI00195ECCDA|nr:ribonuclease P protein component [Rothia sp. ZJ1223]MBM7051803.1 ribonuclease P protein component [Rothia sp. ZJ1223]
MLAAVHRMRTRAQFAVATRTGAKVGRKTLVLYAAPVEHTPTLVGFIVSKAVGNSVMRNKVQRKLRHISADSLRTHAEGYYFVVRALPAAASASYKTLNNDYTSAFASVLAKLSPAETTAVAPRPDAADAPVPQPREEL